MKFVSRESNATKSVEVSVTFPRRLYEPKRWPVRAGYPRKPATLFFALAFALVFAASSFAADPEFIVRVDSGRITGFSGGIPVAGVDVPKWARALGRALPKTRNDYRHLALNFAAAAVAGDGGRRTLIEPDEKIVTIDETAKDLAITLTVEGGVGFAILRDELDGKRYRAEIAVISDVRYKP